MNRLLTPGEFGVSIQVFMIDIDLKVLEDKIYQLQKLLYDDNLEQEKKIYISRELQIHQAKETQVRIEKCQIEYIKEQNKKNNNACTHYNSQNS